MPIFNLPVSTYSNLFGGIFEKKKGIIPNNSSSFSYPIHNRALVASGSRFNFSQGGAEQIPTILRIFGRGVPFARGRGVEGTEGKL